VGDQVTFVEPVLGGKQGIEFFQLAVLVPVEQPGPCTVRDDHPGIAHEAPFVCRFEHLRRTRTIHSRHARTKVKRQRARAGGVTIEPEQPSAASPSGAKVGSPSSSSRRRRRYSVSSWRYMARSGAGGSSSPFLTACGKCIAR